MSQAQLLQRSDRKHLGRVQWLIQTACRYQYVSDMALVAAQGPKDSIRQCLPESQHAIFARDTKVSAAAPPD